MKILVVIAILCVHVCADIFMHNPRGSNNRLNEDRAKRRNGNRLFDSQNNARGGYNVGDKYDTPSGLDEGEQYNMKYFQSHKNDGDSYLTVEWTHQHGCGDDANSKIRRLNCDVVIQMMCQPSSTDDGSDTVNYKRIRNGVTTTSMYYPKLKTVHDKKSNVYMHRLRYVGNYLDKDKKSRGIHEPLTYYDNCIKRTRNTNLFTADQELAGDESIYTRQNKDGTRYGYECPEEKDYYPYWHPTPWKDIAILTDESRCSNYRKESFNVQPKHECIESFPKNPRKPSEPIFRRPYSKHNNEIECTQNGGNWTKLYNYLEKIPDKTQEECENIEGGFWAIPYDSWTGKKEECLIKLQEPVCQRAPLTRQNHHGNTYHDGDSGVASNYKWKIPYFPSGKDQRCILRTRYNISTGDFDQNVDASNNDVIKSNPSIDLDLESGSGSKLPKLKLAINTAQYGRTFQDRTHVFVLKQRPDWANFTGDLYNLNVRGKRGNIQQVFISVEYDFFPVDLSIKETDMVHIQWTGSNTHDNKPDGAAGQGTEGTDRHNIVQIPSRYKNIPLSFEDNDVNMFKNAKVIWMPNGFNATTKDLAISMASAGYQSCESCDGNGVLKKLDEQLNNAPASYEGAVLRFAKGEYHYMCTRNNQFTNRNQKGSIFVKV